MRYTHFHKYERVALGDKGYKVYKCMKPGCRHYISIPLVVGLVAECWRCGDNFIITKASILRKRPHCDKCTKGRKNKLREMLEGKL